MTIAIIHLTNNSIGFDVFKKKNNKCNISGDDLHQMPECPYVKAYLKQNLLYEYVGSEDFSHISSCQPIHILKKCTVIDVRSEP